MVQNLLVTNTKTSEKEQITAIKDQQLTMYVCGITPYDYAHVGHGRCYVVFDVLYRLLKFSGFSVTYCRNFTDIDDKLLKKAQEEFGDAHRFTEIAQRFSTAFTEDMTALNCKRPDKEPRVTDHIPQIIAFIAALIEKKHAYVVDQDVYFSIDSDPDYGCLSHRALDELMAGARVQVSDKKKNPLDFALWKGDEQGPGWQSPWGKGRPGWHIECSVLASEYLGKTVDIHGGGMDLIFPHHENELAQSESRFDQIFVRYWMHVAFVRISQEKMSKSLGNFFTLRQVFENYDPMVVRFMILQHHYRSPLDFSFEELEAAKKTYHRLCVLFKDTKTQQPRAMHSVAQAQLQALRDDLNMAAAWAKLFENWKLLQENEEERSAVAYIVQEIFGLTLVISPESVQVTPEIQQLLEEREQARAAKDWARADALRDQLHKLGYQVRDKKM